MESQRAESQQNESQEHASPRPASQEGASRREWTIAAAMLNFPGVRPDGTVVQDAPPEEWADDLLQVADAGFTEVDPTDSWLRVADLSPRRLEDFTAVVAEAGLRVPAISTARRSPIDPDGADENLAYCHRVIDTAPAVGAEHVSLSLMRALNDRQRAALWFWTEQGPQDPPDDPEMWALAVARFRELGEHAAQVGVVVSLEMYEDTYLGSADSCVRLVRDVDHPAVRLNPDLTNLLRLHRPVEHWRSMMEKVAPYTHYWHVKSCYRIEDPPTGTILTTPAPLESGVIDYRTAVRMVLEAGFSGAFLVEHYGGDGLSVSARNRDYLRGVLAAAERTVARRRERA